MADIYRLSDRVSVVPVIHGSGDCTLALRRLMLDRPFDCLAVPLPPSCQHQVESAVDMLPMIFTVIEPPIEEPWQRGTAASDDGDSRDVCSYTPVEPCQPVIAAIRLAMGEHRPRAFIDPEVPALRDTALVMPDPYAMKRMTIDRFSAAILPYLPRRSSPSDLRIRWLAGQLHHLESQYRQVLFPCAIADWPWIREAYQQLRQDGAALPDDTDLVASSVAWAEPHLGHPSPDSLYFLFGELPFITQLHVKYQQDLQDDTDISVDGIKELLLAARKAYYREFGHRARSISPLLLKQCLKYIRNLTLLDRRLTPDLYTIVTAAKQVLGDSFARHVAMTAREYRYQIQGEIEFRMGVGQARLPDGSVVEMVSRLPGPPVTWRTVHLRRPTTEQQQRRWGMQWDPFRQCSWPPEDDKIEQFRTHVVDRARAILGDDLARHEKFTTSLKDGIDIRESLRHWHTGDLYVKVVPPARGPLDTVVMLFDSPADPREYPWRTTWYAEHAKESTLAFFATNYHDDMIGPGIGLAQYGGAMFLFPPQPIPDIWRDPRLDFTATLEERLLAASCLHSRSRHVAVLAPLPPGAGWRRLAKRFHKKLVHLPLSRFGASTVAQLRMVHVLNGQQVRSYAAEFIRKA